MTIEYDVPSAVTPGEYAVFQDQSAERHKQLQQADNRKRTAERDAPLPIEPSVDKASAKQPLPLLYSRDIEKSMANVSRIVEDVLCAGDIGMVFGDPEAGKTTLVTGLLMSVALGEPFLGKRTTQGSVVYIASESPGSVARRVFGAMQHHDIADLPMAIVPHEVDLYFGGLADAARIIAAVKQVSKKLGPVVLIAIDTLARSVGDADENSTRDMTAVMHNLTIISEATGAAVLIVHHTGKDASRGARGSSAIRGAVDVEIECRYDARKDLRILKLRKQRNLGTTGLHLDAKFVPVEIGRNIWGKPVTVSVMEGTPVAIAFDSAVPIPPRADQALAVLNELVAERVDPSAEGNISPSQALGIRVRDWRERYYAKHSPEPFNSAEELLRKRDAKRKEFDRRRLALIESQLVATDGEFVWPVGKYFQ